ncbi:MAG TPA: hypothetical protein VLL56_01845 [Terriglobia bacterium]|nr:hypothetical protein [Terriglobia bacterium]
MLTLNSRRLVEILGSEVASPESIPFSIGDVTAGSETELQAAVAGSASTVDLPLSIRSSNYFKNVVYRAAVGDTDPDPSHVSNGISKRIEMGPGKTVGFEYRWPV